MNATKIQLSANFIFLAHILTYDKNLIQKIVCIKYYRKLMLEVKPSVYVHFDKICHLGYKRGEHVLVS